MDPNKKQLCVSITQNKRTEFQARSNHPQKIIYEIKKLNSSKITDKEARSMFFTTDPYHRIT